MLYELHWCYTGGILMFSSRYWRFFVVILESLVMCWCCIGVIFALYWRYIGVILVPSPCFLVPCSCCSGVMVVIAVIVALVAIVV